MAISLSISPSPSPSSVSGSGVVGTAVMGMLSDVESGMAVVAVGNTSENEVSGSSAA